MASPTFKINGSATTASVLVTASGTVIALLDSIAGVTSVAWVIIRTDDSGTPGDGGSYGAPSVSGSVGQQAQWTALTAGTAATIRCIINGGIDPATRAQSDTMTAYGKFYVATPAGLEVCVAGEQEDTNRESDATHGMLKPFNAIARASTGGSGTDHRLVRWDGTTVLQDSLVTLSDAGAASGYTSIAIGSAPAVGGALNLTNNEGIYGKDFVGNSAQVLSLDPSDYLHLGSDVHVDRILVRALERTQLVVAGVVELQARVGYIGFGNGPLASVGTTRYEKTTAACFRNHGDTDDFVAWQTSDDGATSVVTLGGTHGTADRPKYAMLDAAIYNSLRIANVERLTITATLYQYGIAAACSASGTHRHEDNVSYRWLNGGADYGAISWAGTTLTLGGANATRPTWIYADASSGVALDIAGNTVLQCQAALIAVNQDLRAAAAKDIDCYTNGGYLKPRYTAQNGIVAPDLGEGMAQKDTGGGPAWYWVVETPDGTKKVALT